VSGEQSVRRGVATRRVTRVGGGGGDDQDAVVVEEPLEIRVDGETVAITMRTPGDDALLALGFLYGEGIVRTLADVGTVTHCGRPGDEGFGNVLDVRSGPGVSLDVERVLDSRRFSVTTSSCGVCGRRSIDDLIKRCAPLAVAAGALGGAAVTRAIDGLAHVQPNFARTGGLHAAAACDASGAPIAAFEDVGRHNAVDKTVGALLRGGQLGAAALLAVSGRSSFEIVQKAAVARIPVVASVSAASSLAIDLAHATGITLAAFVRSGAFNVYTHPSRIT
jgi:FdhD protein